MVTHNFGLSSGKMGDRIGEKTTIVVTGGLMVKMILFTNGEGSRCAITPEPLLVT